MYIYEQQRPKSKRPRRYQPVCFDIKIESYNKIIFQCYLIATDDRRVPMKLNDFAPKNDDIIP